MADNLVTFKYMDAERAIERLSSGELYFALPRQLNDSLEVKFSHASTADEMQATCDAFSTISIAKGGAAWSLQPDSAADLEEVERVINLNNERFTAQISGVGIFATGGRADHQAMWAYYADECKGVCFELEWGSEVIVEHGLLFRNVNYMSGPRIINKSDDLAAALVELSRQNPDADIEAIMNMSYEEGFRRYVGFSLSARVASIKHTDWEHEKEIRVLSPTARALPILGSVLKAVHIVGYGCERFSEIYGLLVEKYPDVKVIQWKFDHGEFSSIGHELSITLAPVSNGDADAEKMHSGD